MATLPPLPIRPCLEDRGPVAREIDVDGEMAQVLGDDPLLCPWVASKPHAEVQVAPVQQAPVPVAPHDGRARRRQFVQDVESHETVEGDVVGFVCHAFEFAFKNGRQGSSGECHGQADHVKCSGR
jgi:hypothetical protein